jgi:poly-gamma-glutamate capsule biosynthesis protein CapA/YwtB (metallophosphatase superfamily)
VPRGLAAAPALAVLALACAGRGGPAPTTAPAPAGPAAEAAVAHVEEPAPPPGLAAPAAAVRIELTFVGDVMFGGTFKGRFVPQDAETHDPLAAIAPALASDLALANLETTVVAELPAKLEGNLRFVATPGQVATLPRNGIGAVTLANNHINDLDGAGVRETPRQLADLGIAMIGGPRAEPPVFRAETIEVRGWRVGFVAATTKLNRSQRDGDPRIPFVDKDALRRELVPVIEAARGDHDLVIVVLHWGVQYDDAPSPWQVEAARAFVDAGADAVIGHHPHVLQGIERYRAGVIAYSLGNFVFQNAGKPSAYTGVLRLGFSRAGRCLDRLAFHPAVVRNRPVHHPVPAVGAELAEVADRVVRLSGAPAMSTAWHLDGGLLVGPPACE